MENNRAIIAIALVILIWSGYNLFFSPQKPVDNQAVEKIQKENVENPAKPDMAQPAPAVASEKSTQQSQPVIPTDYVEKQIKVVSNLYEFTLSTTGASIRSITFNQFKETNSPDSPPYIYKKLSDNKLSTFKTTGSDGLSIPADLPYQLINEDGAVINVDSGDKTVRFKAFLNDGLTIIKSYKFYPNRYEVDIDIELLNEGSATKNGYLNLVLLDPVIDKSDRYNYSGPLSFDGEELLEDKSKDLEEAAKTYGESIVWSGYVDKYFVTVVSPGKSSKQVQIQKIDDIIQNKFISPFISLNSGQKINFDYVAYIGPKDYDLLEAVGHHFERAKDYGFFAILAKPLMSVLKFFYRYVGNYGFAIILLTVCIKIIFWPLTQKSYKSMKGMQKLQPEMQKMREKYGSDKQRLNQEMMAFYKENKVNPMGGCLPMLIQIPVFFALYRVLLGAIELRHAPFMFWLTDLSAKDPYYITPLIMGVTMFLQQKMTPTNMDPTQAKIMLAMPVVFTFLFLNFPSGLVIYWMVNNLLTILQQYLIKRQPD